MTASSYPLVFGKDGLVGQLEAEFVPSVTETDPVSIRLEEGRLLQVPQQLLIAREDGSFFLTLTLRELEQRDPGFVMTETDNTVVPVLAESVEVSTRTVETGRVRIHKTVQEQEEVVDPQLLRDNVTVVRVPVGRLWEGESPGTRQEGDTMIIPVLEEVLVVEKRLMLKEEIHVRREQSTFHAPQRVILRREEVHVERVTSPESSDSADLDPA